MLSIFRMILLALAVFTIAIHQVYTNQCIFSTASFLQAPSSTVLETFTIINFDNDCEFLCYKNPSRCVAANVVPSNGSRYLCQFVSVVVNSQYLAALEPNPKGKYIYRSAGTPYALNYYNLHLYIVYIAINLISPILLTIVTLWYVSSIVVWPQSSAHIAGEHSAELLQTKHLTVTWQRHLFSIFPNVHFYRMSLLKLQLFRKQRPFLLHLPVQRHHPTIRTIYASMLSHLILRLVGPLIMRDLELGYR